MDNFLKRIIMQIYAFILRAIFGVRVVRCLWFGRRLWAKNQAKPRRPGPGIHLGQQLVAHWIDNLSKPSYRTILLACPTMSTENNCKCSSGRVWVEFSLNRNTFYWLDVSSPYEWWLEWDIIEWSLHQARVWQMSVFSSRLSLGFSF